MKWQIKPCPFCGGAAELDEHRSFRAYSTGNLASGISVQCTVCGVEQMICRPDVPGVEAEEVVALWNARVQPPSPETESEGSRALPQPSLTCSEDYVVVPREPTEAMIEASTNALTAWRKTLSRDEVMARSYQAHDRKFVASATPEEKAAIRYAAMIAAAPDLARARGAQKDE